MSEAQYPELDFKIIDEADITDELDSAIRNILVECFPKDSEHFSRQRWWHSRYDWIAVATYPEETIAACLSIVERSIKAGGSDLQIAGVGNACALPCWRKKGIIDRVMEFALEEARKRGLGAGLLFCLPELEKVYKRMGWKKIDAAVVMNDESGKQVPMPEKNIAMAIPLLVDKLPGGIIDLMGQDW